MKEWIALAAVACIASGCVEYLTVKSVPSGAKLYINDSLVGATPYDGTREGSCDAFSYRLEKEGFRDTTGIVGRGEDCEISRGRVVAAIFTLGILGVLNPPYYMRTVEDALIPTDEGLLISQGSGSAYGQAFLKTVGGDVKYAAGSVVFLCREKLREQFEQEAKRVLLGRQESIGEFTRTCRRMKADAEGRFEFDDLGLGDYFIATVITWGTFSAEYMITNGGWATESFAIRKAGERARVIVNGVELPWEDS